jgi:hypothetical protein
MHSRRDLVHSWCHAATVGDLPGIRRRVPAAVPDSFSDALEDRADQFRRAVSLAQCGDGAAIGSPYEQPDYDCTPIGETAPKDLLARSVGRCPESLAASDAVAQRDQMARRSCVKRLPGW